MSMGLLLRTFEARLIALNFCKCSDVNGIAARSVLNTVRLRFLVSAPVPSGLQCSNT